MPGGATAANITLAVYTPLSVCVCVYVSSRFFVHLIRKGGDARIGLFQKWLASNGRDLELEATLRCRKQKKERDSDHGIYVKWSRVLELFNQNVRQASLFVARRRAEQKGTVRGCPNSNLPS